MESSPLHTSILRKHARKVIYSSDEEEVPRALEAPDIPCDSSQEPPLDGSRPKSPDEKQPESSRSGMSDLSAQHPETVIDLGDQQCSPWNSEVDGYSSDSSTPAFKRGVHTTTEQQEVVQLIKKEGIRWKVPRWIKCRAASMVILADAMLKHWHSGDNVCVVYYRQGWPIGR